MATLFSDGHVGSTMETASDFSAWTGTQNTAGDTVSVVAVNPYTGANHGKFYVNGGGGGEYARCYKTLGAAVDEVYVAFSFETDALFSSAWQIHNTTLTNGSLPARVRMQRDGDGNTYLVLNYYDGAWKNIYSAAISAATQYWVKYYMKRDAAAGAVEFWIDGVSQGSANGFDNATGTTSPQTFYFGICYNSEANPFNVYMDNWEIADTDISDPAAGQQLYTLINEMNY